MKSVLLIAVLFFLLIHPLYAWQRTLPSTSAPADSTVLMQPQKMDINSSRLPAVRYNYYQELGAACKVEFRLEKATGVPFRFRLGSLQQTDYLERKPNAVNPRP